MSLNPEQSPETAEMPPIEIGQSLPGLMVHEKDRPEGVAYSDQVLPSPYGELHCAPERLRNGRIYWTDAHGQVVRVTVDPEGIVEDLNDRNPAENIELDHEHLYAVGLGRWKELMKKLAAKEITLEQMRTEVDAAVAAAQDRGQ